MLPPLHIYCTAIMLAASCRRNKICQEPFKTHGWSCARNLVAPLNGFDCGAYCNTNVVQRSRPQFRRHLIGNENATLASSHVCKTTNDLRFLQDRPS